jgi:hypothetical protein
MGKHLITNDRKTITRIRDSKMDDIVSRPVESAELLEDEF